MTDPRFFASLCLWVALGAPAAAGETVKLATDPALSPDGKTLVFSWRGDLWSAASSGGAINRLTFHSGRDREPKFSPDGKKLAFLSDRDGSAQVYTMPAAGGAPTQLTFHTAGCQLESWFPDGKDLLISARRDFGWTRGSSRFFRISAAERGPEKLLFDADGDAASIAADGKKFLFTREGEQWFRKGYHGSQAAQVWMWNAETGAFSSLIKRDVSSRDPLWAPDGKGFYYVAHKGSASNLQFRDLASGADKPVTNFTDDLVIQPSLSADGKTLVFRHLFDLYVIGASRQPNKLDLVYDGEEFSDRIERKVLSSATAASFSADGLEVAFVAGGDVWVMDTELREPKQVTSTPEEERDVEFAPDGKSLVIVGDAGGKPDLWVAKPADANKYWWQNSRFSLTKLTDDDLVESRPKFSPDGKKLAFVKGRGELWTAEADGKNAKRILDGFAAPDFDWSPDGKWFAVSATDDDFNSDVFILPSDGTGKPYNLSRHPLPDSRPAWSPDGKMLAFLARRRNSGGQAETELAYVHLQTKDG
ncbi:MAG TPA: hypothetical protein VNC50_14700, partial [Planctomycetia bacterium]|nr:hypothetical protein [Planctomycetia bacterium]